LGISKLNSSFKKEGGKMTREEKVKGAKETIKRHSFMLKGRKFVVIMSGWLSSNFISELTGKGFLTKIGTVSDAIKTCGLTREEIKKKDVLSYAPNCNCYEVLKDIKKSI
jgi:hypothetical protein